MCIYLQALPFQHSPRSYHLQIGGSPPCPLVACAVPSSTSGPGRVGTQRRFSPPENADVGASPPSHSDQSDPASSVAGCSYGEYRKPLNLPLLAARRAILSLSAKRTTIGSSRPIGTCLSKFSTRKVASSRLASFKRQAEWAGLMSASGSNLQAVTLQPYAPKIILRDCSVMSKGSPFTKRASEGSGWGLWEGVYSEACDSPLGCPGLLSFGHSAW